MMFLLNYRAVNNKVVLKGSLLVSCLFLALLVSLQGGIREVRAQSTATCWTTIGGNWSDRIWNCGGANLTKIRNVIPDGGTIEINTGVEILMDRNLVINGALNVHGRLLVGAPYQIVNNGNLNVLGQLTSQDALVDNRGRLYIAGSYFNSGQAGLENTYLTLVSGNFENGTQATVEVTTGMVEIDGSFNNDGILKLSDPADLMVPGSLSNRVTGEVSSDGAWIEVLAGGAISNLGTIHNFNQGEVVNAGQIENFDSGIIRSADRGSAIVNQDGGLILNNGGDLFNEGESVVHNQPLALIDVASGIFWNQSGGFLFNQGRIQIASGGALLNGANVLTWWCTSSIRVSGNYINDLVTVTAPGKVAIYGSGAILGNPLNVIPFCIS